MTFPPGPERGDMPEGGSGAAAPYTDATRARVAMAYEACELADLARATVPIGEDELRADGTVRSPGAALADAARVLRAAHRFFEAAAAFERLGGASPQLLAEMTDMAAHSAATRGGAGELGWWREHLAREPLEAALDLDDWVRHHADGDTDPGSAPVSGGLVRLAARRRDPQRP